MASKFIVILVVVFVALTTMSRPDTELTVKQILAHMSANTAGLSSYQVPMHIVAHVRKGPISVPVTMDGDRYFKAPDRIALKVRSGIPEVAKAFSNTYASLGSPATWPYTYNITSQAVADVEGHQAYALTAVYKRPSNVDHIVLDVDATTFDPIRAEWFYHNGATVVMHMQMDVVGGKYRLPQHEEVEATFPAYRGSADVTFGQYALNVPIDDSVFGGSAQH